jgi:pyruvate/2-oxoglutarate dehydrogenase complex dihydrolipoamide dehydrogenase (E3) component
VTAVGAAGLDIGLRVALVESQLLGGDCLNVGCVPSKTLIRSARVMAELARSPFFGISAQGTADFAAVLARVRQVRADLSPHDSAARLTGLGIDVFLGRGLFADAHSLWVGERRLRFRKAVLATGGRAAVPEIPGLMEAGFETHATIFALPELPRRLAVVGGGVVGCELAQAFRRLGAEVHLLHRRGALLDGRDVDVSHALEEQFQAEGIKLHFDSTLKRVERLGAEWQLTYSDRQDRVQQQRVDRILLATGRVPNTDLNLDAAGVAFDARGVIVNDYLQTTVPHIYAVGDVCLPRKFTHAADASARLVLKNLFFSPYGWGRSRFSQLVIPAVTFTSPEVARVGIDAQTAAELGAKTITIPFSKLDRAVTDGEGMNFLKIFHDAKGDRILGATIVAEHAGEMLGEVTLAMVHGLGLNAIAQTIHAYPTQAEALRKAADTYRRTLLTPRSRALLRFLSRLG